jgi:hypothetical protein
MSPSRSTWLATIRPHKAVYWGKPTPDGYGGRVFSEPREVDVRWEERGVIFVDATGQEQVSQAVVVMGELPVVGGYLWRGTESQLASEELADPNNLLDAFEIRGHRGIPSIRGDWTHYTAFLRRGIIT